MIVKDLGMRFDLSGVNRQGPPWHEFRNRV